MAVTYLIPGINGLRAVAVLAVVLFHLMPNYFPRGYLGVDVFFVISGFILSHSIFIEYIKYQNNKDTNFSLVNFFSRRLLRLAPQLLLMLWIASLLGVFFLPQAWISDSHQGSAIWALFGLSNWYLGAGVESYFEPRAEYNPFLHTWSLGIEVQFYFLFGFFAAALFWFFLDKKKILSFLMMAIFVVGIFASIFQYFYLRQDAFYLSAYRFLEIWVGIFVYWFLVSKNQKIVVENDWFVGLLVLILLFFPMDILSIGLWPHVLATLCTAGVLITLVTKKNNEVSFSFFMNTKPLLLVGDASYAIYVWHWPVIVFMRWTVGLEESWHFLVAASLIFLISAITYKYYETPLRINKKLRSKPKIVIFVYSLFFLMSWWGIKNIYQNKPDLSFSSTFPISLWRGDVPNDEEYPIQCVLNTEHLDVGGAKKTLLTPVCQSGQRHKNENFTVFVAGDSHATAYMAALRGYAGASGNIVAIYSLPGCPFIDLIRSKKKVGDACLDVANEILNDISDHALPNDVLFLPSLRLQRLVDQWPLTRDILERSQITEVDRKEAFDLAVTQLKKIKQLNLRIIIEAPKPIFRTPTFRCADSWTNINPICKNGNFIDRREAIAMRQPVMESISDLQSEFINLFVWDPFVELCPKDNVQCALWRDGKPVYFDADHLSGYGNLIIFESLRKTIDGKNN